MRIVMYENRNAIFDFELPDVIDHLKYYSEQNVREAIQLLETISSSTSEVIRITSDYFGYIVLNLIKADKGSIFCKVRKEGFRRQRERKTQRGISCRTCLICHFFRFTAHSQNIPRIRHLHLLHARP